MALSPKQLRLIFAQLRAKGLLKYTKKRKPATWLMQARKPLKKSEGLLTQALARKLELRLPPAHRKLVALKGGTTFYPTRGALIKGEGLPPQAAAAYDEDTQRLVFVSSPRFTTVTGYTTRPSGATGSLRVTKTSYKRKISYLSHDTALRQSKITAALTYYHEYGHAVNYKGRFSKKSDWIKVVAQEWSDFGPGEPTTLLAVYPSGQATDLLASRSRLRAYPRAIKAWLGGAREARMTLDPEEAWSEAYASYAGTKFRQKRLKEQRPLSFEYMKKFFE